MKNSKKLTIVAVLLLVVVLTTTLCGCNLFFRLDESDMLQYMKELTVSMFTGDGISINILLENPEALGLKDQPATLPLPDFDKENYESGMEQLSQIASLFKYVNYNSLSLVGKCDRDTIIDYFTTYSQYSDYYYLSNRDYIGANDGWNVILPLYLDKLAFKTENDVKNWISLLEQTEEAFKQYAKFEREVLIMAGYARSATTYNEIATQCEGMLVDEEDGTHFLYGIFEEKINSVPFLTEEKKAEYKSSARSAIAVMKGAYQNLANEMKICAMTAPATEKPLAMYEEGKKYYELLFKDNSSSSDSVEMAYNNLRAAFNEALAEAQAIQSQLPEGFSLEQNMTMEALQGYYNIIKERYTEDFPALNVNTPDATFHKVPDAMADFYNPASYFKSAVDSLSAPETIYVNEANAGGYLGFDIISHEGIPGHMLQHAYYKSTGANTLRTVLGYTGYAEGWATYAQYYSAKYFEGTDTEKLAYKMECLYDKATVYLYTIVDIEINYFGKTLEQLQEEPAYSTIAVENVYNYMVQNPAVYSSYGYGYYKMAALREAYKGTDLEFHTAVLTVGPTTYEILGKHVLGNVEEKGNETFWDLFF